MNVLFLDDCPARLEWAAEEFCTGNRFTPAKDASEAIGWLDHAKTCHRPYDVVYLDHDLGDEKWQDSSEENTGMEVVRWVVAYKPKVGRFVVHSMNTPAGHEMVAKLRDAGYEAEYVSFMTLVVGRGGG